MEKSNEVRNCSTCNYLNTEMGTCNIVRNCHNYSAWKTKDIVVSAQETPPKDLECSTCRHSFENGDATCEERKCSDKSGWEALEVVEEIPKARTCSTCFNYDKYNGCKSCIDQSQYKAENKELSDELSDYLSGKSHTVEVLDDMIDGVKNELFTDDISIGLKHYVLSYKNSLRREDGVFMYAEINYSALSIVVNADCNKLQQKDSLLHESIHGIDEYNGIGLNENQVTALATNFLEFIKHNKKLVKYLMED